MIPNSKYSPTSLWLRALNLLLVGASALTSPLAANAPLEVPLGVSGGLRGVHLEWEARKCAHSAKYIQQLERVVRFDLDRNGYTSVIAESTMRSKLLRAVGLEGASRAAIELPGRGFQFLVYGQLHEGGCDICFADLKMRRQRFLRCIPITGNLTVDRAQLHLATREMHRQWFGKEGVTCGKVLYTLKSNAQRAEVWECDYDGGAARALTTEGCLTLTPFAFCEPNAPFAQGALYVSYRRGQPRIYHLKPNQQRGAKVCSLFGNQFMPTYSPRRDQMAFICDHLGHPELYLQPLRSAKQAPQRVFRASQGVQASPTFSPDGRRLALVSNKDGSPRIYIVDLTHRLPLKEQQVRLISRKNRENTAPSWSPDGAKLAYSAKQNGVRQIWIYDFAEDREYPLTDGASHKENPTWAPDSAHLIYNSAEGGRAELYLVDLQRRSSVQITFGPGEKRFPNWRPQPL